MQFSRDLRERVASGEVTVSLRLWQRPHVRVGGVYPVGDHHIEIDSVTLLPFSAVTGDDVARSGERDREALRERAAHARPIHHDTLLHRVEFHPVEISRQGAPGTR